MDELTPDQIQQLIDLGVIDDQQGLLGKQQSLSEQLRYGRGPQGRQAGDSYVAANPLEFVADVLQKRSAGKKIEDITKQQQDLLQKQTQGRSALAKMLLQSKQLQAPLQTLDPNDMVL